ncbi:MAG: hypothetical protein JNM66_06845 [Bryobacterales bacterium]|nr:hypothetical protein [Bryobacterales bacterium]
MITFAGWSGGTVTDFTQEHGVAHLHLDGLPGVHGLLRAEAHTALTGIDYLYGKGDTVAAGGNAEPLHQCVRLQRCSWSCSLFDVLHDSCCLILLIGC